jgi:hypothetical protein
VPRVFRIWSSLRFAVLITTTSCVSQVFTFLCCGETRLGVPTLFVWLFVMWYDVPRLGGVQSHILRRLLLCTCSLIQFVSRSSRALTSSSSSSSYGSTAQVGPWPPFFWGLLTITFYRAGLLVHAQPPTWRTRSPYL